MSAENMTITNDRIKEFFEAGVHFGFSKTRNHPSSKPFIYGFKNRSAVIDLAKTAEMLDRAKDFIKTLAASGKKILFVGNKDEAKAVVESAAQALGMPYVASRWLGGTFTNFPQIKSRIDRLAELKTKREEGKLSVYTKKERLLFDREIARLERYLQSLSSMTELPGAVVVVDSEQEKIVVTEAGRVGVPVISISGTDCDLSGIAYPIVANDASMASIRLLINELVEAYQAPAAPAV